MTQGIAIQITLKARQEFLENPLSRQTEKDDPKCFHVELLKYLANLRSLAKENQIPCNL